MLITLTGDADRPLYEQLADAFRNKIARGELTAGETLPAARTLAAALQVNMHTVLRAYQQLRDEGCVDLKRGRGAVVTRAAENLGVLDEEVTALVHRAQKLGVSPHVLAAMIDGSDANRKESNG